MDWVRTINDQGVYAPPWKMQRSKGLFFVVYMI